MKLYIWRLSSSEWESEEIHVLARNIAEARALALARLQGDFRQSERGIVRGPPDDIHRKPVAIVHQYGD